MHTDHVNQCGESSRRFFFVCVSKKALMQIGTIVQYEPNLGERVK